MLLNFVEPTARPDESIALILAGLALFVSLLAAVIPAVTGWLQRRRDDRATLSEMYLELMELVEKHGLWVVDKTYDLGETSHEDFYSTMPHRRTPRPDRMLRVRARAITSAYASTVVSDAYSDWQRALEAFEYKLDEFAFTASEDGEDSINYAEATPVRDAEVESRRRLADEVNLQLVGARRARRR